jgi:hypothetical protein
MKSQLPNVSQYIVTTPEQEYTLIRVEDSSKHPVAEIKAKDFNLKIYRDSTTNSDFGHRSWTWESACIMGTDRAGQNFSLRVTSSAKKAVTVYFNQKKVR